MSGYSKEKRQELLDSAHKIIDSAIYVLSRERTKVEQLEKQNAELAAQVEALTNGIRLVLPMAKGYACKNPVGSNQQIVEDVERLLFEPPSTKDLRKPIAPPT